MDTTKLAWALQEPFVCLLRTQVTHNDRPIMEEASTVPCQDYMDLINTFQSKIRSGENLQNIGFRITEPGIVNANISLYYINQFMAHQQILEARFKI